MTSIRHYCCTCEGNASPLVQVSLFLPPCPSSFIHHTFIEQLLCTSWINRTGEVHIHLVGEWRSCVQSFIGSINIHVAPDIRVSALGIEDTGVNKREIASISVQGIIWVGRDVKQRTSYSWKGLSGLVRVCIFPPWREFHECVRSQTAEMHICVLE